MRTRPAIAVVAFAVALAGCGSSATEPEPVERASIAGKVRAPSDTEITAADLKRFKEASASRAFLQFWSDLQWQDWLAALDRYSPGLRRVVGPSRMLAALEHQASLYRSVKPKIERESTRGKLKAVRFWYPGQAGARRLSTSVWRMQEGRWTLVFDPLLDTALQSWAQIRMQQTTAPDATKPGKEALTAGIEASELQARYLPFLGLTSDRTGRARKGASAGGGQAGGGNDGDGDSDGGSATNPR